jgi:signal transduction histidine kinase
LLAGQFSGSVDPTLQGHYALASRRASSQGLGRRLLLAFFGISAFSALVAAAAIYSFLEVGRSLSLIDRRIDPILASLEVSRSVERIVATSAALSSATNEVHRNHVFARLSREAKRLQALLNELRDGGIGDRTLAPIEGNAVQLDANLTAMDADVRLRLQVRGRIKDLLHSVFDANEETQRLLSPTLLVYDSQIERFGSLLGTGGKSDNLPGETARPLIAGLLAERSVQRVQQQIAETADGLAQAATSEEKQRLPILAFQIRRAIGEIESTARVLDLKLRPLFLAEVEKFKTLVDGPNSIPQLRQHELALLADAGRLLTENTELSAKLTASAERLVEATKQEVRAATASAVRVQRIGTRAIAGLVVLSLLTSILIVWRYVGRNIVARLNRLSGAMFDIAGGGRDVAVSVAGRDEIAAMGQAVEVFRQNAIERDALLVERAEAAQRLERQVEERTAELTNALQQQTATAEVLQVINSSPGNLAPVFDAMLERALRLCEAPCGHFRVLDNHLLHLVASRGVPDAYAEFLRVPMRLHPDNPLGRMLRGERVIRNVDVADEEVYRAGDDPMRRAFVDLGGARSVAHVALVKDDKLLGTLSIYRREVNPFSDKHIALLQNFAAQAVIAIENARLLNELRDRQAELRVTFDNMGDGVAMFDAERRLAAWNRNFQEILDLPGGLLGEPPSLTELVGFLAERGEFGAAIDAETEVQRFADNVGRHYSYERTRPDGRVLEVRHNPVAGGGVVVIYSDITERKRAEAEIRASRDAAEAALRELKQAQASLIHAEKMASLGQLTAGIAHEIKNPLNFVNNFAGLSVELLDELKAAATAGDSLGDDARAEIDDIVATLAGNLGRIAEHGRRADGIVSSMLAHSRGGVGERRIIDLNALVEEALNLAYHGVRAQNQSFNVTLERDFDPTLAPIELVPQDITRVLLNLFGNGFYAADKRRREAAADGFCPVLRVATRDLGEAVEIRVRDNGTGIAPAIRDRLFQPFVTTKPTGEGTGLGLSISWDIVTQQHGGTLAVDSELDEFTEFTVRLPRRPPVANAA